jgi:hypothetical protein
MTATAKRVATAGAAIDYVDPSRDPYWQQIYRRMLREDLCFFSREMLGLQIGPHMVEWGDMVAKHRRVAINAARDHSKSTFFSYAYPIWRAWSEPGCEVYIFSKTLEQAQEFLDIIVYGRDNLKGMVDIPELQHLVPNAADFRRDPRVRLNRSDIRMTNGSRVRCVGYGKAIRGRHPKYIVLDDPLNDEDMFSETIRRKNIEYFKSAIVNMVTPNGQIVCVGTPYHAGDLWGFLRRNPVYKFKRYPAIIKDAKTGKERAIFPWRWSLEALKGKKAEIGSVAFTREILCQPISDDLSIFPSHLFPPLYDPQMKIRPNPRDLRAKGIITYMGVDLARSASVGADYFVIFVIGVDSNENHYVVDIRRHQGLEFRAQLALIEQVGKHYDPALIFIESNAFQQIYTDEMRRTTDLPVKPFVTLATNKYPLDKGVPSLRILLENQKIVIPRGDELSVQVTDEWIEECTQFGFVDGKLQGAGDHDDTVLAWWFAEEAKKTGGFSFAMGDDEDAEGTDADDDNEEDWQKILMGDDNEDALEDAAGKAFGD